MKLGTVRGGILLLVLTCGCGAGGDEVIPVAGKVLVNGKPAAGARIFFHPQGRSLNRRGNGASPTPMAVVSEDGAFVPTTYDPQDGLPEGEYAVTLIWPTIVID